MERSETNPPPFPLLGPPEIYGTAPSLNSNLLIKRVNRKFKCESKSESTPTDQSPETITDPFMNLMVSNYNNTVHLFPPPKPFMGFTKNHSPTYLSSGNPCVDLFFHVVPDTPADQVTRRLKLDWDQNPLTALKFVCQLRGIRGTGKGDREGFYASALWIHQNHLKTLACNVTSFAEFGYFKDLLEILYRLLEGPDVRKHEKAEKRKKEHKGNNLKNISFAAKWCPLYSFLDRSTLLCESIAKRLFLLDSHPEYEGIDEAHYAYRVRDHLRKEVLVPLRKVLKLPEIYMSANQWNVLPYTRVTSIAMRNYKELFLKHDEKRFQEYLDNVKHGKKKIAAGALPPHEIIASLDSGESGQVAELQWQRIVDDLSMIGKLKNCLAICDVSGSMYGVPLKVSVALGLLVSELSGAMEREANHFQP
ncbi:hypothetical protein TEA_002564 [Camellia sinensis var. sinensis]|uniref:DUF2828 domain-containing protein n=1 Tax=Camellia sinensis var. sinensis TaxID=542762 RepID=A0A4S4DGU3_CAMSN|nr:hypothetical protein TEA_002564 [Camellia sinensis var. sinensis]